jgi:Cation transport ATPase
VICYSLYKNCLESLLLFYYSFVCLYSGTVFYDPWLIFEYNLVFTALPVIVMGAMDIDVAKKKILKLTLLYSDGISSKFFNTKVLLKWTFKAIVHSLLIFCLLPDISSFVTSPQGFSESAEVIGTAVFFVIVQTVSYELLLKTDHWN